MAVFKVAVVESLFVIPGEHSRMNCTKSLEKIRSKVESKGTLNFFFRRGRILVLFAIWKIPNRQKAR